MKRFKNWLEGGMIALLACMLVGTTVLSVPVEATANPTPQQQTLPEKQFAWPIIIRGGIIGASILLSWFYKEEDCMGWPTRIGFAPADILARAFMPHPGDVNYVPIHRTFNNSPYHEVYRNGYRSYKAWGMCFNLK